nr:insulin-like isoform X2 [Onthophagus taurus]
MSKTWTIYFFLLVTSTLSADSNQAHFQQCGTYLSQLLSMVCKSRYNSQSLNKRSIVPIPIVEMMVPHYYNSNEDEIPQLKLGDILLPRKHAIQVLKGKRRVKRGVYDECCIKPCTYAELHDYCLS